jgi:hypothetical protein
MKEKGLFAGKRRMTAFTDELGSVRDVTSERKARRFNPGCQSSCFPNACMIDEHKKLYLDNSNACGAYICDLVTGTVLPRSRCRYTQYKYMIAWSLQTVALR